MQDQQKSPRAKHCEVVSDVDHLKVDIQAVIREKKSIKQYAYILHDKDDTAPHYHIYLNFGTTSVSFDDVGRWFGLSASFVSKVNGRKVDMLEYLTHANESQKHKHQYSPSEVVANFDFETEIAVSKILGNFDQYSYAQQLEYVNSLPVDEKAKAFSKLEKLWKLHCQCLLLKADRQIEVMFIQGKGGSGKTYYAKRLLEKMGYDYAISSSSNDPFQDYLGQSAIILDDLRYKTFSFEDLLKILDNNTASSVKSRFTNKVLAVKLIVITTTVPLRFWFPEYRWNQSDSLYQLYRRITSYVKVDENFVQVFGGVDDKGDPAGIPKIFKNELQDKKRELPSRTDFGAIFGGILEDATEDVLAAWAEEAAKKRR